MRIFLLRYRRGGRAVEGARLESVCRLNPYRGFESLPLRLRLIELGSLLGLTQRSIANPVRSGRKQR